MDCDSRNESRVVINEEGMLLLHDVDEDLQGNYTCYGQLGQKLVNSTTSLQVFGKQQVSKTKCH